VEVYIPFPTLLFWCLFYILRFLLGLACESHHSITQAHTLLLRMSTDRGDSIGSRVEGGEAPKESEKDGKGTDGKGMEGKSASGGSESSDGFQCNICLDVAADPVITQCGHLFWYETHLLLHPTTQTH
jgi:hypothetical protein